MDVERDMSARRQAPARNWYGREDAQIVGVTERGDGPPWGSHLRPISAANPTFVTDAAGTGALPGWISPVAGVSGGGSRIMILYA
jgi:hypothetical protein